MQASKCAGERTHPGFETHGEGHTKSKTGAISGPTKWTLVQQKKKKRKEKKKDLILFPIPDRQLCAMKW